MKRAALLPLVAGLALGCGIEFSAPLADTSARLTLHLELVDSLGKGEARLSGSLWPGFTPSGNVRFLLDSSLTLWGRTIAPSTVQPADTLRGIPYAETWSLDPDATPGEVALEAPEIPGVGEGPPVLRLTPPWRAGPAEVIVAPGSPLTLDLLTGTPSQPVSEWWRLDIMSADGHYVGQIGSAGPTPPAIEVPGALLAPLGTGGKIHLVVVQSGQSPAGARYALTFLVTTRHLWSVTVQP